MKRLKLLNLLLIALCLTLAGTGCRKKPYGITPLPGQRNRPSAGDSAGMINPGIGLQPFDPTSSGLETTGLGEFDGRIPDRSILQAETVYFDFDSSVIKSSETSKLEAVAAYLKGNSANALLIEGHCDERGTEEYNRSLGERRALALREHLATLGVNPGLVRTLSYGEDKPADPGQGDAAWAQNRRGEFVVLLPKP